MTDSEIKVNVLQAKDQWAQIKICAELNDMSEEEVRDILKAQGVDLRKLKGCNDKRKTSSKPAWLKTVPSKPAPVSPITEIKNKIESLLAQRSGIDAELEDMKKMLTELIDSIGGNNNE